MNINDPFHATVSSLHGTVDITFTPPAPEPMVAMGSPAEIVVTWHDKYLNALTAIERLVSQTERLKSEVAARNADIEQLRAPRDRDRESLVDRLSVLTELDIECPRCGAGPGETCTWQAVDAPLDSRSHLARMQANRERLHRLLGKVLP